MSDNVDIDEPLMSPRAKSDKIDIDEPLMSPRTKSDKEDIVEPPVIPPMKGEVVVQDSKPVSQPVQDSEPVSQPVPDNKFIMLDARGKQIKVPEKVLMKSKVFKDWLDTVDRRYYNPYFMNHCEKDVHNMINYLSDYKYKETDELTEMLAEFSVKEEEITMKMFKTDDIASVLSEGVNVYFVIREIKDGLPINRIVNYLKRAFDVVVVELDKKEILCKYIFKCYNKTIMKVAYDTYLKTNTSIKTKVTDIKVLTDVAKEALKKRYPLTKYIYISRTCDMFNVMDGYHVYSLYQAATKEQMGYKGFCMVVPI